jgi:hypothetical protein
MPTVTQRAFSSVSSSVPDGDDQCVTVVVDR